MGTDMQMQQNMIAQLIHIITSFSDSGKCLTSLSGDFLACSLRGDSRISRAIGKAMTR